MAQEQVVTIPTVEYYFKTYAVDGIGKGADKFMIRRQLIDAFRREMFDQIALRTKKTVQDISEMERDPEILRITKNIVHNTMQRWKKLCTMFNQYLETSGLIKPEDLNFEDEETHA